MTDRSPLHRWCLLASALVGAACVPYNRSEPLAPQLAGSIRYADDSPAAGMRVGLAERNWRRPCRDVMRWATSDEAGSFNLPATDIRRRWLAVLPNFDRAPNTFEICYGRDSASLTPAYAGTVRLDAFADTISCVLWSAHAVSRQSCASRSQLSERAHARNPSAFPQPIQVDGAWTTPTARGFYRLLIPTGGSQEREPILQWVQRLDNGVARVVDSLELPLATKSSIIDQAELRTGVGGTCLIIRSTGGPANWHSWGPQRLTTALDLGPPGQVTQRSACGRN
jgi:hypothetical protein